MEEGEWTGLGNRLDGARVLRGGGVGLPPAWGGSVVAGARAVHWDWEHLCWHRSA